jgi:ribonuclease D
VQWQLIQSDFALEQLLAREADAAVVIVDTEFMRRNTFYPEVALVQLCFVQEGSDSDTAWLIDPLCITNPAPLAALMSNPAVLKVLHSASEDLEVFQRWLGVLPQPLFDTQRAAAILNIGFGLGYRALVQDICAIDLPKGETRSDWLQRPLTQSQCEYAGLDVIWLLPVWRELHARCVQQNKLVWVLEDGRNAITTLGTEVDDFHKRIKMAWKLDRRQLGALAAICKWREDTARLKDKPRAWIIDDQTCLQLALKDPTSMPELRDRVPLAAPVLRRYGADILAVLAEQRETPEHDLPAILPAPLDARQRETISRLKACVREIAGRLSIAPEVLVQSKDYELLLREMKGDIVQTPVHWMGWRNDIVLAPLRQALSRRDL